MSRSRITANALTTNAVTVLDDIGYLFDNYTKVFSIKIGGALYPLTDGYQTEIYLGAHLLKPYITIVDNVYLGTVSPIKQGYIISGSTLTFINAPSQGVPFYGRILSVSPSANTPATVKSTFNPLNILLS